MKTKIILTVCAFLMILCTVGCAAKTELTGTAWKSSNVPFVVSTAGLKSTSNYTATVFFMKNNALGFEVYPCEITFSVSGIKKTQETTATGTGNWTATGNNLAFDVEVTTGQDTTRFSDKNYTVKIENDTMTWLNSDGTTYATWEKRK